MTTEDEGEQREDSQALINIAGALYPGAGGGLVNPLTGLGTSADRTTATTVGRNRMLTRDEMLNLYTGDVFIQKAVDLVVKEAYRNWVTFDFANDTKLQAQDFLQYMWKLKFGKGKIAAREAFMRASILARRNGDAFILVGTIDNAQIFEPVGDKVQSVAWLKVMSRWEIYPEPLWVAMQEQDYSKDELPQDAIAPEFYRITQTGQRVHHSRVLRFSGNKIYDRQELIANSYYNYSVIQSLYKTYARWEEGMGYGAAILGDIESYTLGIKGMARDLNNNPVDTQKKLLMRGQSLSTGRSLLKTILYDLDNELPGNVSRGFQGAEGIMDRLERAFSASANVPRWKLFEESGSAGLASGVGSAQILRFMWADIASSWAFENWKEPLDQFAFTVFSAKDSPSQGVIPEEWNEDSAKFPNNITLSKQEEMELEKVAAERSQILISTGVTAPEEVRRGYEGSSFSSGIPLLPEVGKRMKDEQAIATQQKQIGLQSAQKQLNAPPPPTIIAPGVIPVLI